MDSLSPIFAKRLKELRESKGISLATLSNALTDKYGIQISKESLTNYEVASVNHTKAKKNEGMSVKYLRCLADFYGVSTDYLLGLSDIPTNKADIQAACLTTGLDESAVYFLKSLKERCSGDLQSKNAIVAINILLSENYYEENLEFWHKIFIYLSNSGKSFRALIEGEVTQKEFSGEDILGVYLLENNKYLGRLRDIWQQTHKGDENGKH